MEPYKKIDAQKIYHKKRRVKGKIVAILNLILENRGLSLIVPQSRVLKKGEIHEIIVTEENKGPGDSVEEVAYVGFFEVKSGGVAIVGDVLEIDNKKVATLIGFNETHMPNHQNIVFRIEKLATGKDLDIEIDSKVEIG